MAALEQILGGFGKGFAKGFEEAGSPQNVLARKQAVLKEKQAAIEVKKFNLLTAQTFMDALKPGQDKAFRKFKFLKIAEALEIDPKSSGYKDFLTLVEGMDEENLSAMIGVVQEFVSGSPGKGKPPSASIVALAKMMMTGKADVAMKFIGQLQKGMDRAAVGAAVKDTASPSGAPQLHGAADVLLGQGMTDQAQKLQTFRKGRQAIEAFESPPAKRKEELAVTIAQEKRLEKTVKRAEYRQFTTTVSREDRALLRDLNEEQRTLFRGMLLGQREELHRIAKDRRELEKTLSAEDRTELRALDKEQRDLFREIAQEQRLARKTIQTEDRQLAKTLDTEDRELAKTLDEEQRKIFVAMTVEQRAEVRKIATEIRAIRSKLGGEKRALAIKLDQEKRDLFRTKAEEQRKLFQTVLEEQRAEAATIRKEERNPPTAKIQVWVNKDGTNAGPVDMNDPAAVSKALSDGRLPLKINLAQLGQLNPTLKAKLRASALSAAVGVNKITAVLAKLKKLPAGVTGVRAKIALGISGIAEQLGDILSQIGWGDFVAKTISGADQETLQAFTTDAVQVIASNIAELTGERGQRVSEFEWLRAKQAGRILNAAASPQQIQGALVSMLSAKMHRIDRIAFEEDGRFLFDVSTKATRAKTGAELKTMLGLDKEAIAGLIVEFGANQMLLSRAIYHGDIK